MSVLTIGHVTQAPLAPALPAAPAVPAAPVREAAHRRWRVSQRKLGFGVLAWAAGMVTWRGVLAVTLPSSPQAPYWSAAWRVLDGFEALGLAATGWLLRRGDRRRCLPAAAT